MYDIYRLLKIAKDMGKIIRKLDENNQYSDYWLNDGTDKGPEYVPIIESDAKETDAERSSREFQESYPDHSSNQRGPYQPD